MITDVPWQETHERIRHKAFVAMEALEVVYDMTLHDPVYEDVDLEDLSWCQAELRKVFELAGKRTK